MNPSIDLQKSISCMLETEVEAVQKLHTLFRQPPYFSAFEKAVDVICQLAQGASTLGHQGYTGRLIVTGVGKSGHIARKTASTMASTGTPAQFVHPTEASHGDLGMITRQDAILAFSWSGESVELSSIMDYAKRHNVTLLGITQQGTSTLAKQADITLLLPEVEEICPLQLAPTTSSMLQLVLGDLLACAALAKRGFTKEDFKEFHPGGRLGLVLQRVKDIMYTGEKLPLVRLSAKMGEAILVMTSHGLGCAGVVDEEGNLVGIITDGDLRRHMRPSLLEEPASAIMTKNPKVTTGEALLSFVIHIMNQNKITALFVLEENSRVPVGIIHMHDLIRAHNG